MPRRSRPAIAVLGLAVLGLGACGAPGTLDHQQQAVEARECASLVTRHASQGVLPRVVELDGRTLDLQGDPEGYWRALEELRPPSSFDLTSDRVQVSSRASYVGDRCDAKTKSSSSSSRKSSASRTSG